jgi:hypothetical protein
MEWLTTLLLIIFEREHEGAVILAGTVYYKGRVAAHFSHIGPNVMLTPVMVLFS